VEGDLKADLSSPLEVIVLAGGQGRRLQSVVSDLPKPMANISGRPFLWWLLTRLSQQGVDRVILSVGYKAESIQDYFGDHFNGIDIAYSVESEPLGTGGAIRFALEQAGEAQAVVLNGDTYSDIDLWRLRDKLESSRGNLVMALTHLDDVSRYGAVLFDEETETIVSFNEKEGGSAGYINAGIYCLRRDIFDRYPVPSRFSFERDFLTKWLSEIRPVAFPGVSAFIDIGVPEDFALAQTLIPAIAQKAPRSGHRDQAPPAQHL
jgi:D-glycero-alpha-D-manno-heptose 1-phosphate guanylyltransferase